MPRALNSVTPSPEICHHFNSKLTFISLYENANMNSPVPVTAFIDMLYDKAEVPQTHSLPYSLIVQELFEKPLFSELFGIDPTSPRKPKKETKKFKVFS